MKFEDVEVGKVYAIGEENESGFEVGELVEVIELDHFIPNGILAKSLDTESTVCSIAGLGTQLVEAHELEEI